MFRKIQGLWAETLKVWSFLLKIYWSISWSIKSKITVEVWDHFFLLLFFKKVSSVFKDQCFRHVPNTKQSSEIFFVCFLHFTGRVDRACVIPCEFKQLFVPSSDSVTLGMRSQKPFSVLKLGTDQYRCREDQYRMCGWTPVDVVAFYFGWLVSSLSASRLDQIFGWDKML